MSENIFQTNGGIMSAFEKAKQFFESVENLKGWEGCKEYVADGATFTCQSDALADVKTVEAYCEWMAAFGKVGRCRPQLANG